MWGRGPLITFSHHNSFMKTDSFFRITQLGVCRQSQFQQFLLLNRLVTRVLSDSSLHYPEKSGGKATGFIERLLQHVQAASWFETRDSVSRVAHYWWIYRSNVRPSSPAAVCRWGLSTAGCRGSSSGTSGVPPGQSPTPVPERRAPVTGTALRRGKSGTARECSS